jgi:hypothetical protein
MRELRGWPPGLGAARDGTVRIPAGRTVTVRPRPGLPGRGCACGTQLKITALVTVARFPASAKVMGADARFGLGRSLWD